MQRRRDGKEVCIRLVAVRAAEVVGVAGEDLLGKSLRRTADLVRVALRSVEDGRVERVGDVLDDVVRRRRQITTYVSFVGCIVCDERAGKEETFVGIVTDHDADPAVEVAVQ